MADKTGEGAELLALIRQTAPTVHTGKNVEIRRIKADEPGKLGHVVIVIDADASSGPTGSGLNITTATLGRNVMIPDLGGMTFGLNVYRPPTTAEERAECEKQAQRAADVADMQAKIKALRAK